jgi:hypothetical protein
MYNPWPGAYLPDAFQNKLYGSLHEKQKRPIVVVQKLNTLNSKWPENTSEDYAGDKENLERNACLNNFLKNYHYKKVWENTAFEIFIPDVQSLITK